MKKPYEKALSIEELASINDEDIDYSDIPPLDEEFWANARVVHPSGRDGTLVTLRVKDSVLEAFKATGDDCERRMSEALEAYASHELAEKKAS